MNGKIKTALFASLAVFAAFVLAAAPLAIFAPRLVLGLAKIDVHNGDKCWNIPPAARAINAKGSYLHFTGSFEIAEDEMLRYAESRGWSLSEMRSPVRVAIPAADNGPDGSLELSSGLLFNGMTSKGGFIVAYDRISGKGYIEYSHH